jgi:membrane-bound lytic murein transglycosylase MltF
MDKSSAGIVAILCLLLAACGGKPEGDAAAAPTARGAASAKADEPQPYQDLDTMAIKALAEPWFGDYDGLAERRFLRVVVPYSRTYYYMDGVVQKGASFELLREFEKSLPRVGPGKIRPKIVIIPTTRDRIAASILEGRADIAVGGFAITAFRQQHVDFSRPLVDGIEDVVVTRKGAPPIATEADLAGREIHVRPRTGYADHLAELNARLGKAGLAPVVVVDADLRLEDEDIMQMVDAGILPATVVQRPVAEFWAQIYDRLEVHAAVPLRNDGRIGWVLRKDMPQLRAIVDEFVAGHREGTLFGNVLLQRYLGDVERIRNPADEEDLARFRAYADYFRRYASEYQLDWLLLAAQGYQESQLDQSRRSPAGAVGVMQLKPSTAADRNVGIADIRTAENNIHAGAKYLRFLADRYFSDPGIDALDQGLFALAAYNAGPARVARLRAKAATAGLDPDAWFHNVEVIAARDIGRETVDYVSNIYKYYVAYKVISAQRQASAAAPP